MNGLVKSVVLVTFVLSVSWKTESYTVEHKSYVEYDNRTLARFRRQAEGQRCKDGSSKFQCATTADCIDLECDGKEDCPDGSDEKESLCKNISCPAYLFRCDYGACISTEQRCDGVKNCNDNSDEINCVVPNDTNTDCRSDQFKCSDGQCIEIDGMCDGIIECNDKSDETEELCLNMRCPGYTYKCKYGACVDGDAECNGIQNCLDNSDEDEKICSDTPGPIYVPAGKNCTTPAQPYHGNWTYLNNGSLGAANVGVTSNTVVIFECETGYKLSSISRGSKETQLILCGPNGDWSFTVMPTCQKLCPKVYDSPLITVSCKTDGSVVPCDKATDNTILRYKCAPYYEAPHEKPKRSICYDGSWDYTPECIPVCGEKRVSGTSLIPGTEVERGNYPWVVALYSNKDTSPYYTNICGGSLITNKIVLTAAHCVTKLETGKAYAPTYYMVGAGKYYNRYKDPRDDDIAQYSEVAEIRVHDEYRGEAQNFRADLALLKLKTPFALSKVVQPVCYYNLPSVEPNTVGLVSGWGYTNEAEKPSERLKEVELLYTDREQCVNELDPDFAWRYFTSDKICAAVYNQNTNICKGDNGGGLVFRNPTYEKRFFIHGIVSVGRNQQVSCNSSRSTLFTKVDYYVEWIHNTMLRWSKNRERETVIR